MENENKSQSPGQININNSVNNYGVNHGAMGHSVSTSNSKPQTDDTPAQNIDTAIWKGSVVKLVGEGRTEEALAEILKTRPPEDIRNQAVLLAGRFSQLKIERIAGILEKETELKELNNIRDGILLLISRC